MGIKTEVRASICYNRLRQKYKHNYYSCSHLLLFVSTVLFLHSISVHVHAWPKKNQQTRHKETNTNIHSSQGSDGQSIEQLRAKYASLPHTIFSPQGRLFNVEKAAISSSDETDASSNLVFAFKFGGDNGNDDDSNSILVISTSSSSPYLHHHPVGGVGSAKGGSHDNRNGDGNEEEKMDKEEENEGKQKIEPLWKHDVYTIHPEEQLSSSSNNNKMKKIIPSKPISIISPNLIIGTGGNAIDSIVLHTKILEIFLSLSKSMDGMNATHRINGNYGLKSSLLARKIADMLQIPTQDVSANSGRVLSSSALVIGMNEVMSSSDASAGDTTSCNHYNHEIWRIDPTGQFWNCQGAAVGRGAGLVEGSMLKLVKRWKEKDQQQHLDGGGHSNESNGKDGDVNNNNTKNDSSDDLDTILQSISREDVEQCFRNMAFDEAIKFACDCICKVHKISNTFDIERVGVQGMLLPSSSSSKKPEMIHPEIITECLNTKIHPSNQSISTR